MNSLQLRFMAKLAAEKNKMPKAEAAPADKPTEPKKPEAKKPVSAAAPQPESPPHESPQQWQTPSPDQIAGNYYHNWEGSPEEAPPMGLLGYAGYGAPDNEQYYGLYAPWGAAPEDVYGNFARLLQEREAMGKYAAVLPEMPVAQAIKPKLSKGHQFKKEREAMIEKEAYDLGVKLAFHVFEQRLGMRKEAAKWVRKAMDVGKKKIMQNPVQGTQWAEQNMPKVMELAKANRGGRAVGQKVEKEVAKTPVQQAKARTRPDEGGMSIRTQAQAKHEQVMGKKSPERRVQQGEAKSRINQEKRKGAPGQAEATQAQYSAEEAAYQKAKQQMQRPHTGFGQWEQQTGAPVRRTMPQQSSAQYQTGMEAPSIPARQPRQPKQPAAAQGGGGGAAAPKAPAQQGSSVVTPPQTMWQQHKGKILAAGGAGAVGAGALGAIGMGAGAGDPYQTPIYYQQGYSAQPMAPAYGGYPNN